MAGLTSRLRAALAAAPGSPSPVVETSQINASADFDINVANSSEANDLALIAMRDHMLSDPQIHYDIFFEPSANPYKYTNNRWLLNVRSYSINAYGASFECQHGGPAGRDTRPLNVRDLFDDFGDVGGTPTVFAEMYRFDTAGPGGFSVAMTTTADAAEFAAGDRVVLFGFDQEFGGYVPNARYFEYKTVASVDEGAGTVSFTEQLQWLYDADWLDYPGSAIGGAYFGKPRIIKLERENFTQPVYARIAGATFLQNSVATVSDRLKVVGTTVVLEDINARGGLIPSTSALTFYDRVRSLSCEPDKFLDRLIIRDSEIGAEQGAGQLNLISGTGINSITLERCRLWSIVYLTPRILDVIDCDFLADDTYSSAMRLPSLITGFPVQVARFSGNKLYKLADLDYFIEVESGWTLTVGGVSGTDILIDNDSTGRQIVRRLDYGFLLVRDDGGNAGIVTGITHDGDDPGQFIISGTWATPMAAEVYNWRMVNKLVDGGGNYIAGQAGTTKIFSAGAFVDSGAGDMRLGITASTTQSQGQCPLFAATNIIETVANPDDVVTAPSLTHRANADEPTGTPLRITNRGANQLQIFPASDDDLGAGANMSVTLAAGLTAQWTAIDSSTWNRDF